MEVRIAPNSHIRVVINNRELSLIVGGKTIFDPDYNISIRYVENAQSSRIPDKVKEQERSDNIVIGGTASKISSEQSVEEVNVSKK